MGFWHSAKGSLMASSYYSWDVVHHHRDPSMRLSPAGILLSLLSFFPLTGCAGPYVFQGKTIETVPELTADAALMPDGFTLPVLIVNGRPGPPRAVVLALHGFNDYSRSFLSFGEYLAARNITLIAYDQRGFGRTEGRRYWHGAAKLTGDLRTMVRLLKQKYQGTPLFILGDSMGGAVILAAQKELQAEGGYAGVTLVAPAVWARNTMPWYQRSTLWLFAHLLPWFGVSGKGLDIDPSDNIEMLRELGRDPLVIKTTRVDAVYGLSTLMDEALASAGSLAGRAMILYGRNDEIIPRQPTCEMLKRLPSDEEMDWRFVLYDHGHHMLLRDLQAEVVHHDIEQWIGNILESSESQQETIAGGAGTEDIDFLCNE
jgi:alpha-beta hydrolase superfamily lysophospholipase